MFPLKKSNITVNEVDCTTRVFSDYAEIPLGSHPGAFGVTRKNHIHEGVDIYCHQGDDVIAVECGVVVKIIPFTGEFANSPWWNNTYAVIVKHKNFYMTYGEIAPLDDLFVGQKITEGQTLGYVTRVLKKDKGRPMDMLHVEMYHIETDLSLVPASSWELNSGKPKGLMNPTAYLIKYVK